MSSNGATVARQSCLFRVSLPLRISANGGAWQYHGKGDSQAGHASGGNLEGPSRSSFKSIRSGHHTLEQTAKGGKQPPLRGQRHLLYASFVVYQQSKIDCFYGYVYLTIDK